jgi:mRNA deadenylase 3'-5' endonuclease subunit Ccr4
MSNDELTEEEMGVEVSEEGGIKVVTFNVLSPGVCNTRNFNMTPEKNLNNSKRLEKILLMMDEWIDDRRIIALQELSTSWKSHFHQKLVVNGYSVFDTQYANMGVAIAYPLELYSPVEFDVFAPGKCIERFTIEGHKLFDIINNNSVDLSNFTHSEINNNIDALFNASKRLNKSVSVKLRSNINPDIEFWVSTYHMPCKFNQPVLMSSHLVVLMAHLKNLVGNDDLIFMGDLNVIPSSSGYNILIDRNIPENLIKIFKHSNMPYPFSGNYGGTDVTDLCCDFTSAHMTVHNIEPDFTNVNIVSTRETDFIETLDYILKNDSDRIILQSCHVDQRFKLNYKNYHGRMKPFPTEACPSDHLPLLAYFVY